MKKQVITFWISTILLIAGWIFLIYLTYKHPGTWILAAFVVSALLVFIIQSLHADLCIIPTSEYRMVEEKEMCATLVKRKFFVIQQGHDDLLTKQKLWLEVKRIEDALMDGDVRKQAEHILLNIKNGVDPHCHIKTKVLSLDENL